MMPACLNQGSGIGIAAITSLPERRAGNFARAAREAHLLYKGAAQRSAELQDMRRFVTRMGVRRAGVTAVEPIIAVLPANANYGCVPAPTWRARCCSPRVRC